MKTVSIQQLKDMQGADLGFSPWRKIDQKQIDTFADATDDHQWIHVNPAEAALKSPTGTTIMHGYLTMSLGPVMLFEVITVENISVAINYGIDRLRFPAMVPVGSELRLGVTIVEVSGISGGVAVTYGFTFQVKGQTKPACVANVLVRYYE